MGASGGFPVDLVLFGMIAAFLVLRLRSILGRRQGFERPEAPPRPATAAPRGAEGPVIEGVAERPAPSPSPPRPLPDPASPAGQALTRMQRVDRNFSGARFVDGAETAFRMIVTAFAAGQRDALRPLLSPETFRDFDAAITAREANGETQRTEVRGIHAATIEAADLRGSVADITVRFVSDQVNLTLAGDGSVLHGTDAVTEIADLWTFERDLAAADPTWRLVAARSA
ncbi:MAG TPA: Tim44/TimA family putative adaptor protein [Acetobacteraceae bacterium]|nr:Tim44/TimA family putative adaptor protein [Acetobacteraceae bacterium]